MNVFIYALNCPTTGRTRYIGKAADPYARYEGHLDYNLREKTHKANWIRSVMVTGENPRLEILDEVPEKEWQFWEREWIKIYRMLGFRLTNGTSGGDTGPSFLGRKHSPESRAKMSAALTGKLSWFTGKKGSKEHRAKISVAMMGNKNGLGKSKSLETKAKVSAALKRYWAKQKALT